MQIHEFYRYEGSNSIRWFDGHWTWEKFGLNEDEYNDEDACFTSTKWIDLFGKRPAM